MYLFFKLVFCLWVTGIFEGWLRAKVMLWYSNRIILPSTYHFALTKSFCLTTNSKETKNTNICEIPQLKLSGLKSNLLFFCREQWKLKNDLYSGRLFSCPSHVYAGAFIGMGVWYWASVALVFHKSDFFMSAVEIHVCSQTLPVLGSHCHSVCCTLWEWSEATTLGRAGLRMSLCSMDGTVQSQKVQWRKQEGL